MSLTKLAILIASVFSILCSPKNPHMENIFHLPNEHKKRFALYLIRPMFHLPQYYESQRF